MQDILSQRTVNVPVPEAKKQLYIVVEVCKLKQCCTYTASDKGNDAQQCLADPGCFLFKNEKNLAVEILIPCSPSASTVHLFL